MKGERGNFYGGFEGTRGTVIQAWCDAGAGTTNYDGRSLVPADLLAAAAYSVRTVCPTEIREYTIVMMRPRRSGSDQQEEFSSMRKRLEQDSGFLAVSKVSQS